jgi:hypothetical protein
MTTGIVSINNKKEVSLSEAVEAALVKGDLSSLSVEDRIAYYYKTCESLGLNPLTKPFDYIQLNGKLTLYAKKDCADQLRKIHGISVEIRSRETIGDLYIVTARAYNQKDGRIDESTGVIHIANLRGDALANSCMKCETKAKRRVTLSICGLGILDESEIESIPGAFKDVVPEIAAYDYRNPKMQNAFFRYLEQKNIDKSKHAELSNEYQGKPFRISEFDSFLNSRLKEQGTLDAR